MNSIGTSSNLLGNTLDFENMPLFTCHFLNEEGKQVQNLAVQFWKVKLNF
jgi:hypothetical protein